MDYELDRLLAITKTESKQKPNPVPPGTFWWHLSSNGAWIKADTASLQIIHSPIGRIYWAWQAWTGSHETKDLFMYSITLDYDENIIEKTYKLGEQGLTFKHCYLHSNGGFTCTSAQSAEVFIKLDPKDGISTGDFKATFSSDYKSPNGAFNVTRQTL